METTWRTCWAKSWKKVMNDTLKELEQWKRIASSNSEMSPLPFNIDIEKLNSYRDLQNHLKNAHSEEENHWRIRSAYKASNLLYRVLKHSIPMYYEGALKIRYYPNRPSELISTPNPSPKLKGITKAIQQDREELMSHEEFEERIKHLARANRYRVPKFPDDQFAIK
ncbi:unnamed protein product, partial [Rhizoctonia solani]